MKKLTIIAGLLLASVSIFAQSRPIKLSLRGSLTSPTGDWKISKSTGGLLELQANKPLSDHFSLFASVGYGRFSGNKNLDGIGASILPILAGFNVDGKVLHAGLGIGYTRITEDGSLSKAGISVRPEIGVNLSKNIQLNLNYTYTITGSYYKVSYFGITPVFKF
jgi:hypothetical protein